MKKILYFSLLSLTLSGALANAAVQHWDTDTSTAGNDTGSGAGLGGSGNWSATDLNWWDGSAASLAGWIAGDDAVLFGSAGTLTIPSAVSVNSITSKTDSYRVVGGSLTMTGSASFDVQTGTTTNGSLLLGTVGYTKTGAGTLVITNLANSISGPVFLNQGVLELVTGGRIGSTSIGSGDVTLNGGTYRNIDTAAAGTLLTTNRGIVIGANGGTINIPNSAQILLYAGLISGAGNTLTINGPGELRLTTNSPALGHNTFGKLVLDGAMLALGQSVTPAAEDSLGAIPASPTDDAITLQNGGRLRGNVIPITLDVNRGITIGPGGGLIRTVNSASTLTIPSKISGANPLTIGGGSDTGIVALSNTNNSFGDLIMAAGSLRLDATEVIPNTSALTVSNGTFLLNSNIETVASLTLIGGTITGGGGTLIGSSYDFRGGTFGASLGGTADVIKTTTNTVTLNAASYTNTTVINAGKIVTTSTSITPGLFSVSGGATLGARVSGVGASVSLNNVTLSDTATNEFDLAGLGFPTAPVLIVTNLSLDGIVRVSLKGSSGLGTAVLLQYASRSGTGVFMLGDLPPHMSGTLVDDTINKQVTLTITNIDILQWTGSGANWDINNSTNTTWRTLVGANPTYYQESSFGSDLVQFDDTASGTGAVSIPAAVSPLRPVIITNSTSKAYSFTGAGKISGSTALIKSGNGALTLSTANDFTGGTTINDGTVNMGNNAAFGTGKLTINGGTIKSDTTALRTNSTAVDLNGDVTFGAASSGDLLFQTGAWTVTGGNRQITVTSISVTNTSVIGEDAAGRAITKAGNGVLNLTAANTFSGGFNINAGTVRVNANAALGAASSPVSISNGVVLATTAATARTLTYNYSVLGNFTLGQFAGGTGPLTLAGTMELNGAIRTITNGSVATNVISAVITNGGLVKIGTNTLDLTGGNGFTNGFNHTAGIVRVNNATALGAVGSPVSVANGIVLSTTAGTARTLNHAWTVNGNITLGQLAGGVGTVTMAGTMDLGGATRTFTLINTNDTISAAISNGGLLVTNNGATLTLSGVSTYSGDTIITNGAGLTLNGTAVPGSGTIRLAGARFAGSANRTLILANPIVMTGDNFMTINTAGSGNRDFPIGGPITATDGTWTLRNGGTVDGRLNLRIHTDGLNFTRPIVIGLAGDTGLVQLSPYGTNTAADQIFSGVLSGYGTVLRSALVAGTGGRTIFTGDNTYSGGTTVSDGSLIVNNVTGSGTGSGAVVVSALGILAGSGSVSGAVSGAGSVSAGNGVGVLTLGAGLNLTGTNLWELSTNATGGEGSSSDLLVLSGGDLVLGPTSRLRVSFVGASTFPHLTNVFWQTARSWKVISLTGSASNSGNSNFSGVDGADGNSAGLFATSVDASGNIFLNFTPAPLQPIIEPNISGAGTTNAVIAWSSVDGVTYEVQYKDDLNDVNWTVLGTVTATSSTASIPDPTITVPAQRFYRIVIH